jgi:long-chain acyl-CoA synthetase
MSSRRRPDIFAGWAGRLIRVGLPPYAAARRAKAREETQTMSTIPSDEQLLGQGMAVAVHARRRPDKIAIASPSGNLTWAEFNAKANQLVCALRKRGLSSGDGVALLAHNGPEFAIAWAATQRSGLRLTAVNWHQATDVIAYVVDNCDARALIASGRFAQGALEAAKLSGKLVAKLSFAGEIEGFEDFNAAMETESGDNIADAEFGSTMLYTSGTTGRPKGVYRRTRPVVSQLTNICNETAQWNPDTDLSLLTGPLYHAAPLGINFVIPINAGVGVLLMDKWDAEETLRLIEKHKATHTHVVPTMMHRMLQLPEETRKKYDLTSMRWMIHGAAPCPAHVKQSMMEWFGPVLYEYYSSTEGGGVFVGPHEWLKKPGTVGKPVAGVEIQLLDLDGKPVPQGTEGLIYVKAPATGRFEYYKEQGKTDASYRGDWFTLGDMGKQDADGDLFLTGRTAELIISGGVNIYPVEIDEVLIRHPLIADAAVVGVPNEDWGEEIKAVVELKQGVARSEETKQSIFEFAKERLPGFQRPRTIDFVDTLPRNAAGKVLRAQVRAPYWAGRSKSI